MRTYMKTHVHYLGLHFCQGLHARFTNDVGKAIQEFNLCRKDSVSVCFRLCASVYVCM